MRSCEYFYCILKVFYIIKKIIFFRLIFFQKIFYNSFKFFNNILLIKMIFS